MVVIDHRSLANLGLLIISTCNAVTLLSFSTWQATSLVIAPICDINYHDVTCTYTGIYRYVSRTVSGW